MEVAKLGDYIDKIKWNTPQYTLSQDLPISSDKHFKIVCVGDGAVGKTCMLISYVHKSFPGEYIPTALDMTIGRFEGSEATCSVSIWDTAGREDSDRLRVLSYPHTRVFLACYSVVNPSSFENLRVTWVPEVRRHCRNVPVIIVGCKTDLRNDADTLERLASKKLAPVTFEQGLGLARQLGCEYSECSAYKMTGLSDVFSLALKLAPTYDPTKARIITNMNNTNKKTCILM